MSTKLEQLFQLQALDTKLLEKQRTVGRYEGELAERRAAIAACDARMDEIAADRKEAVGARALAERRIEDLQAALKQKRQRAQKARNEKEARAGHDEVKGALEEIGEAETALLEAMTRVDEFEAVIETARAERAEIENEDHRHVSEAAERIEALRAEIEADRRVRDEAAAGIDARLLKKYDFLLGKRAGLAVVEVDETGGCSGCHVAIPPQVLLEIRRQGSLKNCPMCQRILFTRITEPNN